LAIKFINRTQDKFFFTLRNRVESYFKDNNISKYGDYRIWIKAFVMLGVYVGSYTLILTSGLSMWWLWFFAAMMGVTMAGTGLTVMHDACHGTFSKNNKINDFFGFSLNFLGGHAMNWKIQHNFLHHTYTNIEGMDEDIAGRGLLRFSPHAPKKWIHKYQHFYAWFLYGFMTVLWVTYKDFAQISRYSKQDFLKKFNTTKTKEYIIIIVSKIFYYFYMVYIPYMVLDIAWWQLLIGFLTVQFMAGWILAFIFQLAHVMEETEFPLPNENETIESAWAVHQIKTTSDFGQNSKFLNWFAGGLNFQVEHHLFPGICHLHYKNLSKIVKETAEEYGIPYFSQPSFFKAFVIHHRFLKELGGATA
jgi:linoleoyl-CoA desaturase